MRVFHCPVCPLIFEFRTEVEYHLRNEHRSRADEKAELASELAAARRDLEWGRLRALQSSRAGVAVTIIMATTPGPAMASLDIARLRRLAYQARRRVAAEAGPVPPNLEERLSRAVVAAESYPTEEGLALMVNPRELAIFRLPFEPVDRVVVDPTFATRDLEAALQCYPRYRLVVLGRRPRLVEGRGRHLVELETDVEADELRRTRAPASIPARAWGGKRSARPERWSLGRARRAACIELADELLASRIDTNGELPLLVAGDERWRADFRRQSRHTAAVIGEITGTRTKESLVTLAQLAQPHLARRLHEEQAAAKAELEQADAYDSVAWGLKAAWAAVHGGAADLLWVEQGFARPGHPSADGKAFELVGDPEQPGVIDDLVDDLIEDAIERGVGVHLLAAGIIDRPEPIAARTRTSPRTARPPMAAVQAS